MKRIAFVVALVTLAIWAVPAGAYETYSSGGATTGNCAACHGDFRASGYLSRHDNSAWVVGSATNLHDIHRNTMLSGDCNVCHSAGSRSPVFIGSSVGGTGFAPIACMGCHGREQDMGHDGQQPGRGAGLRQHHTQAGIAECADCHADASLSAYTPVSENIAQIS